MHLAKLTSDQIAFDKGAIMRRAHHEGRFALRMRRTIAQRRAQLSHWLKRAWKEAKREAAALLVRIEQAAQLRIALAERARQSVALVASYGGAEGIRQAIASEQMRDRMDFAAIAKLEAALATISGAHS
jgi:hypothetical protein